MTLLSVVTRYAACSFWLISIPGMSQAHLSRSDITMIGHRQRGPARDLEIGIPRLVFNPGLKIFHLKGPLPAPRCRSCLVPGAAFDTSGSQPSSASQKIPSTRG